MSNPLHWQQVKRDHAMTRIVDLTLPVVTGMAGIPKIPLYEQYPVKVQAATVVDEDQRGRTRIRRVEVLDDRNRERERLPGPSRRLREHVAAVEDVGENEGLDPERPVDVALCECLRNAGRHAQLVERLHIGL